MKRWNPGPTGDLPEAYVMKRQNQARKIERYIGLSVTRSRTPEGEDLEEVYRAHIMDLASRRLRPYLLGVVEGGCSHDACSLMTLNSLAVAFVQEQGWDTEHTPERAAQLVLDLDLGDRG